MKTTIRITLTSVLAILSAGCGLGGNDNVRSDPTSNKGDSAVTSATGGGKSTTAPAKETSTTAKPAAPALARASDFVGGNIDPKFGPGDPGKLSVVAIGTPDGEETSIPFVVRNNTARPLYDVSATGRVTSGGKLVGSGESQDSEPAVVAPGEIGFGYVYFSAAPPAGSTLEVAATADSDAGDIFKKVAMTVGEANNVAGQFGDEIVGEVTAPADTEVSDPVGVLILCVDAAGKITGTGSGYTDGDASILPGTSATYSVSVPKGCPTFLVGSSGTEA